MVYSKLIAFVRIWGIPLFKGNMAQVTSWAIRVWSGFVFLLLSAREGSIIQADDFLPDRILDQLCRTIQSK